MKPDQLNSLAPGSPLAKLKEEGGEPGTFLNHMLDMFGHG